jgi:hypothetical protein
VYVKSIHLFSFAETFARLRRTVWAARLRRTLAAIFSKEAEQTIPRLKARRVDHRATVPTHGDQSCVLEPVKVKRHGIWGEAERVRDSTGSHP